MNSIFIVSFIVIMFFGILSDWNRLQAVRPSQKAIYYLINFLSLGLLISKLFHINVPLPSRFFVQTISPWISRTIGL